MLSLKQLTWLRQPARLQNETAETKRQTSIMSWNIKTSDATLHTSGYGEMFWKSAGHRVETLNAFAVKDLIDNFGLTGVIFPSTSLFGKQKDFFIERLIRR